MHAFIVRSTSFISCPMEKYSVLSGVEISQLLISYFLKGSVMCHAVSSKLSVVVTMPFIYIERLLVCICGILKAFIVIEKNNDLLQKT